MVSLRNKKFLNMTIPSKLQNYLSAKNLFYQFVEVKQKK